VERAAVYHWVDVKGEVERYEWKGSWGYPSEQELAGLWKEGRGSWI
jgi:hypothetical protein